MSTFPDRRENLFRASYPGISVRSTDGEAPLLNGHFAVFGQQTEINSRWEGNFLEQIAPGAFTKTFAENRDQMRVLFQHGKDPQIGDKPLGAIESLSEDKTGAHYEVRMIDTAYNRDLLPALEQGLYGASFRFKVMQESVNEEPEVSSANPRGIPERTIREAKVMEFGPVTWGAYTGATSGVRSITDLIIDIDAVTAATPILLDDERLAHARAFISRAIDEQVTSEDEYRGSYSADQRKQMAANGHAMPDGSYPIGDAADVKSAAGLVGHSKKYSAAQIKAHVIKNAKRLGAMSALPASWMVDGTGQMASADETGTVREQDAPPVAEAEKATSHLRREGRESKHTGKRVPIYGVTKEEPRWLL